MGFAPVIGWIVIGRLVAGMAGASLLRIPYMLIYASDSERRVSGSWGPHLVWVKPGPAIGGAARQLRDARAVFNGRRACRC